MSEPRILLVDDETSILRSLRRVLRKEQYDVVVTSSPAEALEYVEKETFAVVVSDQRMPEMEGTKLLERIHRQAPETVRIILTGYADMDAAVEAINRGAVYRFLNKPWDDHEFRATLRQAVEQFELVQENRRLQALTEEQNAKLKEFNANLKKKVLERTRKVVKLNQEMEQSFKGVVEVMARLAEMHSPVLGNHSKRVASLSKEIAEQMGLPPKAVQAVELGAMLHDIGKTQTDPSIIGKPSAALSGKERAILALHPIRGAAIVRMVPHLDKAALFVKHHHERYDGHGYPDKLKGGKIPLGARIIAVADAYDNILNLRSTFTTRSPEKTLQAIQNRTPAEFDPMVVDALMKVRHGRAAAQVEKRTVELGLDDLEPGMVLARNLTTGRGTLLLKKDAVLDPEQIKKLERFNDADPILSSIFVYRNYTAESQEAVYSQ